MKRYWKVISLIMLTVLIIGTFYIDSRVVAKTDMQIGFETLRGDENELEPLSFRADYEKANNYQTLKFTKEETIDLNRLSLLESLNRAYSNNFYKRLVEDYKGFMRGKIISPENYYEDEELLAYVEIHTESVMKHYYEVDVLHKKSGENITFEVDFSNEEKFNWASVMMVQVVEDELKVFVRGFTNEKGELMLMTFNIKEQKLDRSEKLLSTTTDNWWDGRIIRDTYKIGSERYVLINFSNEGTEFSHETEENTQRGLMIFDFEKEEFLQIVNIEEMMGMVDLSSIRNSTLYFPSQVEGVLEINRYDIEKQVWGEKLKFDLAPLKEGQISQPYVKFINDKLYIVSAREGGHTLLISDATSGKVLYEGMIHVKRDGEVQSDYRLYINNVEVIQ